jgi:hypothetical protein
MPWNHFKNILVRLNICTIATLWLGFWGYGLWAGDIPPASVIPGLLLGTLLLCMAASVALFALCHISLFARAKSAGTLPPFSKKDHLAVIVGMLGVGMLILLGLASNIGDGILIPTGIVGALMAIYGILYALVGFGGQFFRWQFSSPKEVQAK